MNNQTTNLSSQIAIYESPNHEVRLDVRLDGETVWLSQAQIAELFGVKVPGVSKHLKNIFETEELDSDSVVSILETTAADGKEYRVAYYNLDAIISVGYRVNSKNATAFRRWATTVLRQHLVEGYTVEQRRLEHLGKVIEILGRSDDLVLSGAASVLQRFMTGLDLLDEYDHQSLPQPKGDPDSYELTYEDARDFIDTMKFGETSELFGHEKDDSFKGIVAGLYQSFGGVALYPTVQAKAANLLYMTVKDHSFSDGNKRIAAAVFVYFLDRNGVLFRDGRPVIDDSALAAATVMIAVSKPEEKDSMVLLVQNMLTRRSK